MMPLAPYLSPTPRALQEMIALAVEIKDGAAPAGQRRGAPPSAYWAAEVATVLQDPANEDPSAFRSATSVIGLDTVAGVRGVGRSAAATAVWKALTWACLDQRPVWPGLRSHRRRSAPR